MCYCGLCLHPSARNMSILYCFMYSISFYVYYAVLRSEPDLFHHVITSPSPSPFFCSCLLTAFCAPDNCSAHAMPSVLVFTARLFRVVAGIFFIKLLMYILGKPTPLNGPAIVETPIAPCLLKVSDYRSCAPINNMSGFRPGQQELPRGKHNFVDLRHYPTN